VPLSNRIFISKKVKRKTVQSTEEAAMGATYRWKCNKCWHSFKAYLGYGMRGEFPEELTEEARKGVYGVESRALLAFYPYAEVSDEQVIV